jgi:hypothetical protein
MSVLTTFPRKSEMDYANGGFVDHFKPSRSAGAAGT